jgi:hypothetical protein
MVTKKLMKSGAQLRAFRRHLATRADRPSEKYTRTLKFPLEDTGFFIDENNFQEATRLYNITEGISDHSLYSLLMQLHLGGLRLFSSAAETHAFGNKEVFNNNKFKKALDDKFGIQSKGLSIETIYKDLQRERRNTGGKIKHLSGKGIADDYYQLATGKKVTDKKGIEHKELFNFLKSFGDAIEKKFGTWSKVNDDIKSDKNIALACFDEVIKNHKIKLPSLKNQVKKLRKPAPGLEHCSIAYDPTKQVVKKYHNEIAIHIVVAQYLQDIQSECPPRSRSVKYLQDNITTPTHNGLSWLLGKGLDYLTANKPKIIAEQLGTKEVAVIKELIKITKAITPINFLSDENYSKYRTSFGSKLNSWIANYTTRLYTLKESLESMTEKLILPEGLNEPQAITFFGGMAVSFNELNGLIHNVYDLKGHATKALDRLLGIDKTLPKLKDVETIEGFSGQLDAVSGLLEMLSNRLKQEMDKAKETKNKDQEAFLEQCFFVKPKWLKKIPKLNKISGGVPDYKEEIKQTVKDFNTTRKEMEAHFARITKYCESKNIHFDVLGNLEKKEQEHIDLFKALRSSTPEPAKIRAYRNLFQRLARAGMNCGPEIQTKVKALFKEWGVLKSNKNLNRLFNNRQGAIYQSLFSNRKHEPYELNPDALNGTDYLKKLDEFLNSLKKQVSGSDFSLYNDLLKLEKTYYGLMLGGLPDGLPSKLGQLNLPEDLLNLSPILKGTLSQKTLRAEVVVKAFNHYHSILNGLVFKLLRKEFLVRTKFSRVGDTGLIYRPKDKTWKIPERYRQTSKAIGTVLNEAPLDKLLANNDLNVRKGIKSLCTEYSTGWKKEARNGKLTPFLRESPHDWNYLLGYGNTKDKDDYGFQCKKDGPQIGKTHQGLARLIGPSSFKEWLDKAMLTEAAEVGDITLIIDQRIKQKILQGDSKIDVTTELSGGYVTLALPLTEKMPKGKREFIFDHFVGIDLGEVGIGYARYKVKGFELIESGTIPIRSIRNLMSAVDQHRKLRQPQQKFQASYNPLLAQLRANAIGDTLGVIDGLMEKLNAFPIFESSVGNFERGANQLKMVYESVIKHYTYSDIDAHKNARKHHWCGGDKWQHPDLKVYDLNENGTKTGKIKELNLFPGATVHPAYTSQTCSQCHRNPVQMAYKIIDEDSKHIFTANAKGQYKLSDDDLVFLYAFAKLSTKDRKTLGRQKRNRLPLIKRTDDLKGSDMVSAIRACLRHRQESTRSKDTSQSRYRCLFVDCGHAMHADENAAINIGYKWRTEKLVSKK